MHSKFPISKKIYVIPTTSRTGSDITASSPSNPPFVITPNAKLQIHKWSRNAFLVTGDSMISGIDEKRLSKKHPAKVFPFPGASADDMHHYLRPLLQKCSNRIILHVATSSCFSISSRVVLDENINLQTFIQKSLPQCKLII